MKEETYKCDRCGEDITLGVQMWHRPHHVNFALYYWHGGSMGGEEDVDRFDFDLCDNCARQLSSLIKNWLKENKKD